MTDGHQYGLRIRAVDPFNEVQFGNNGYSEIRTFWFGFNPNDNEKKNLPLMPLLIVLKIAITPQISVPTMLPILLHFLNGRSDIL